MLKKIVRFKIAAGRIRPSLSLTQFLTFRENLLNANCSRQRALNFPFIEGKNTRSRLALLCFSTFGFFILCPSTTTSSEFDLKPPISQVFCAKNAWESSAYIARKEMYKGEFSSVTRNTKILSVPKA